MKCAEYLVVKNFERFQHYKDRAKVSWIKLYASLLTDYEFHALPDRSKAHLMLIWLLVSQRNDRRIPNDPHWVAQRIGATDKLDLQILIDKDWLIPLDSKGREIATTDTDFNAEALNIFSTEESTKEDARRVFHREIATGRIAKEPCVECGKVEVEGHHRDYSKPLEILWLCVTHHKERHNRLKSTVILLMKSSSVAVPPNKNSPRTTLEQSRSEKIRSEEEDQSKKTDLGDEGISVQELFESWNNLCPPMGLASIRELSQSRRAKAASRIREHPKVAFWEDVFAGIKSSAFLLGRTNGNGNGKTPWKIHFDWLIENDTNCIKVAEGRYSGNR